MCNASFVTCHACPCVDELQLTSFAGQLTAQCATLQAGSCAVDYILRYSIGDVPTGGWLQQSKLPHDGSNGSLNLGYSRAETCLYLTIQGTASCCSILGSYNVE